MAHTPSSAFAEEIFKYLKGSAKSTEMVLKSLGISSIVYVINLFFIKLFACPHHRHRLYGFLFIFGPALILFCISLLICIPFWRLTLGLFHCRRVSLGKSRKIGYLALLSPIIWLILAFADANYYVCATVGPVNMAKTAANSTAALEALEVRISDAQAESQIIAWALIISLALLATVVISIERCLLRQESKIFSKKEFKTLEANYAVAIFNEKIKPMAETQARQKIDELFESSKEENPYDFIKLGKKKLTTLYPNILGGDDTPKGRALRSAVRKKFKNGGETAVNEEEVLELTERDTQKLQHTSIA